MRLFASNAYLAQVRADARREERAGIKTDIQYMVEHQGDIQKMNGNYPVHNGWHGISVRFACALITQRQFNDDFLHKK